MAHLSESSAHHHSALISAPVNCTAVQVFECFYKNVASSFDVWSPETPKLHTPPFRKLHSAKSEREIQRRDSRLLLSIHRPVRGCSALLKAHGFASEPDHDLRVTNCQPMVLSSKPCEL